MDGNQPPPEVASLLDQRRAARERRDFATADALRDQLRHRHPRFFTG